MRRIVEEYLELRRQLDDLDDGPAKDKHMDEMDWYWKQLTIEEIEFVRKECAKIFSCTTHYT